MVDFICSLLGSFAGYFIAISLHWWLSKRKQAELTRKQLIEIRRALMGINFK